MKFITLKRITSFEDGTFGVLLDENIPFALTCELQWNAGDYKNSCIPNGAYKCKRIMSSKFGETFEITGVKGRTHILFHKGNIEDDTRGCILIGEQFEKSNNKTAILLSKKGFDEFMERVKGLKQFILVINWCK